MALTGPPVNRLRLFVEADRKGKVAAVQYASKGVGASWKWLLSIFGLALAVAVVAAVSGGNVDDARVDDTRVPLPGEVAGPAEPAPDSQLLASARAFAVVPAGYRTCTTDAGLSVSFPELWLDPRGCPEMESTPMPLSPDGMARVSIQHLQASSGDNPPTRDASDAWPAAPGLLSADEVEELEIDGLPAVKYTYLSQSSGGETKAMAVLVEVDKKGAQQPAYAALNLEAPKEEFGRYSAIFEQISRTLRLERHEENHFDFEFDYGQQCARLRPEGVQRRGAA
jgi:hypothetical protein